MGRNNLLKFATSYNSLSTLAWVLILLGERCIWSQHLIEVRCEYLHSSFSPVQSIHPPPIVLPSCLWNEGTSACIWACVATEMNKIVNKVSMVPAVTHCAQWKAVTFTLWCALESPRRFFFNTQVFINTQVLPQIFWIIISQSGFSISVFLKTRVEKHEFRYQ